jgi:hypothetical protein
MSSTLANSANIAITANALGLDINNIPRMDGINSMALTNATPKGMLNVTKINMSNYDNAVKMCIGKTYDEVKAMNRQARVSSTDTSCGWIRFASNSDAGASILGTNTSPIGTMPSGVTAGSKYYPPLLTTSAHSVTSNWPKAISCIPSDTSFVCTREGFSTRSTQYASVDDEFTTPFLRQLPTPSTTPITRDSYIRTDTNAGAMVATLYQESDKGLADSNLQTRSSYSIFNKAMTNTTGQDAESWEKAFQTETRPSIEYPRPSRDISVLHGNLEAHDFCAEMNDQTVINENNLPCLQREWLQKGGSVNDYNYPTSILYGTCRGRIRKN